MPLLWYRDYSDKTDEELRVMARVASDDRSHREDLIRTLMGRDTKKFVAILAAGFVLSMLWSLFFRQSSGLP